MDVGVGMAANLLHTFNESHIEMFYLIVQEQNLRVSRNKNSLSPSNDAPRYFCTKVWQARV